MTAQNIMVLILEKEMNNQEELHRVKKNDLLRLGIGASLQGQHVRLFTNFPINTDVFIRDAYHELQIVNPTPSQNKFDSFDNYAEFEATLSGSFQFYFTTDGSAEVGSKAGEGYFIVDPRFKRAEAHFELDGLVLQTYLSKNLGPFPEWKSRIRAAINGRYNMVHFTPLQELGYSRSAYSLRDQLKVNPWFSSGGPEVTWEMIAAFVNDLSETDGCLSMTDLVYNHTASDSPWIHEHPECGYNLVNSPHLRPAYLLDRVVWNITIDVAAGKYVHRGLTDVVNETHHLDIIREILRENINLLNLHEFFQADVDHEVDRLRVYLERGEVKLTCKKEDKLTLNHGNYHRLRSQVNLESVVACLQGEDVCGQYRALLHRLNDDSSRDTKAHMEAAVGNVLANISYRFVDGNGLRLGRVTEEAPLMWTYFYHPDSTVTDLSLCEARMDDGRHIMAYNGWVMNHDPLVNFAEEGSNVYLRRELIVWGDSVKLRYGAGPVDCPYLWTHMMRYTEMTAGIFHAVRLDNCHSTPLHVAQAMLDRARAVRPDLYIVAELFTGSEAVDNIFVNKLGINSLIREAQSAWSCHEQGRLVHKYGGLPIGAFVQQSPQMLQPSTAHALLYDMTHDNESPVSKRSVNDLLPSAAVVGMACCAIGSTRGYDEVVPHYIDVVHEERPYRAWGVPSGLSAATGIVRAKAAINHLHQRLAAEHYSEVFVDQLDEEVVAVTRLSPSLHRSVVMVAHTAFGHRTAPPTHRHVKAVHLSGTVTRIVMEGRTVADATLVEAFEKDPVVINGLRGVQGELAEDLSPGDSTMVTVVRDETTGYDTVHFKDLPVGCVVALEVAMTEETVAGLESLRRQLATHFSARLRSSSVGQCLIRDQLAQGAHGHSGDGLPLRQLIQDLDLNEMSRLLFRCHEEEMAEFGAGSYDVPHFGKLVFCGLQGLVSELHKIRTRNDLGHPICNNLRDGDWLLDYVSNRLMREAGPLHLVGEWFQTMFLAVRRLPRFLVPAYFDMVVSCAHKLALEEVFGRLGDKVASGSSFLKGLALGSVMLCSEMRTCELPPLAADLDRESRPSMSAGFPHFAEGIWRNWGRDTFLSLRGLAVLTDRYQDARSIILTYAATVRHGMIPNLLGDGFISRYNARDATWFWLYSIREYELSQIPLGEDGQSVLMTPVARIYPDDSADGHTVQEQPLFQVIQEVLQRHADGINFRERNAGPKIDEQMQDQGFHVEAGLSEGSLFPRGGNKFNCGTWMDKMGSCSHAGNKGWPATPRDGSAVELVGLCASVLEWLVGFTRNNKYSFPGVKYKNDLLTWDQWLASIKGAFEKEYFIPLDAVDPQLAYNRGIYRDTVHSSLGYTDNQFRPNYLVTMTVAPSLFNEEHAWYALELVEKELLGPLGMRTLSPRDWAYRGYYDNSNDSGDPSVSHGFNYHQGPEWIWLTGYYIRAKLIFSQKRHQSDPSKYRTVVDETVKHVTQVLGRLHHHLDNSRWKSLPELTNKDGEFCQHSCEAQAWSIACTLEAMIDLIGLESAQ